MKLKVGDKVQSKKNRGRGVVRTVDESGEVRVPFTGSEWFFPHAVVFRPEELDEHLELLKEA